MKKFTAFTGAALMAFSLTACGGGGVGNDTTINTEQLVSDLLDTVTSDTLSQTAEDLIPSIYYLDAGDVASAIAYASSGATSCEIAVIESTDSDNTENVEENMQARVNNQTELYASYNQSEAARLDTAIIKSTGKYTVLVVCDDTEDAENILKEYGF